MRDRELRKAEARDKKYLTPAEAALLFGKHHSTIRRWIERGLPVYRFPDEDQDYLLRSEVVAFLTGGEHATRRRRKPG